MLARAAFLTLAFLGFLLPVSGSPVTSSVIAKQTPAAIPTSSLPRNLTRSLIHWKGVLEEGQPEVYLNGASFDDIEAQVKSMNPSYTIFNTSFVEAGPGNFSDSSKQLIGVKCQEPGWQVAFNNDAVWDGVHYLQGLTGNCRADPAGNEAWCGRVSCSWDSAIFFCNQQQKENWAPCKTVGDRAADAAKQCSWWSDNYQKTLTQGEAFNNGWWSAVIASDPC